MTSSRFNNQLNLLLMKKKMTSSRISLLVQEIPAKRKSRKKAPERNEALDDTGAAYEEVKKDLSALSREEQMDVLYR
jgi:hypothetical protein